MPSRDGGAETSRDTDAPLVQGLHIAGRVTDFEDHALVGVRVEAVASGGGELDLLPAMTDGEGRFVLEGLAEGRYDLRCVLGRVRARTLGVPAGTEDLEIRLARPQGLLLVVKTLEGEAPPDILHVLLERETATGLQREHVGRYLTTRLLLWSIRPGRYAVTVWGGPWLPVRAAGIEVQEEVPAPLVQLLLSAHGGRVGVHVREGGQPAARALVTWRRLDAAGPWPRAGCSATCDEFGRFEVRGLPTGTYLISAGRERGPFADREVEVTEGQGLEVELDLAAGPDASHPEEA